MIHFIRGKVVNIETEYVVVETNNIGYEIFCPNPYVFQREDTVIIYTYQYVREDVIRLYGFKTKDEKKMFEKLLSVSGIGPKGALAILAAGDPHALIQAIEEENEKYLIKFPGVGKKTARQMILDLKGKLTEFDTELNEGLFAKNVEKVDNVDELEEALEALRALGYVEREIKKILPHLKEETLTTDQYIKKALSLMLNS